MSKVPKGKFVCPSCSRRFIAAIKPRPTCRRCSVHVESICRRCDHVRPWMSISLQYCGPCVDFIKFRKGGGISETSAGRLSARRSRAVRLFGAEWDAAQKNPSLNLPLPQGSKRSRTSRFAKAMRKKPTVAEARMLTILRRVLPGKTQVQAQWQFGCDKRNYILDFYIREVRLGIEVDGSHHRIDAVQANDIRKEDCLERLGVTLVRITNRQVDESSDEELVEWLRQAWRLASHQYRQSQGPS